MATSLRLATRAGKQRARHPRAPAAVRAGRVMPAVMVSNSEGKPWGEAPLCRPPAPQPPFWMSGHTWSGDCGPRPGTPASPRTSESCPALLPGGRGRGDGKQTRGLRGRRAGCWVPLTSVTPGPPHCSASHGDVVSYAVLTAVHLIGRGAAGHGRDARSPVTAEGQCTGGRLTSESLSAALNSSERIHLNTYKVY